MKLKAKIKGKLFINGHHIEVDADDGVEMLEQITYQYHSKMCEKAEAVDAIYNTAFELGYAKSYIYKLLGSYIKRKRQRVH